MSICCKISWNIHLNDKTFGISPAGNTEEQPTGIVSGMSGSLTYEIYFLTQDTKRLRTHDYLLCADSLPLAVGCSDLSFSSAWICTRSVVVAHQDAAVICRGSVFYASGIVQIGAAHNSFCWWQGGRGGGCGGWCGRCGRCGCHQILVAVNSADFKVGKVQDVPVVGDLTTVTLGGTGASHSKPELSYCTHITSPQVFVWFSRLDVGLTKMAPGMGKQSPWLAHSISTTGAGITYLGSTNGLSNWIYDKLSDHWHVSVPLCHQNSDGW